MLLILNASFKSLQAFKYLLDKPIDLFTRSAQFLQILSAESEGLVTVDVHIQREPLRKLTQEFYGVYLSDLTSADATAWNKIREEIIMEMLQHHLLPLGARWTREWLKELEEEWVCSRCAARLEERIDVAPYQVNRLAKGQVPRVMAVSAGRGDLKRDWVHLVVLSQRSTLIQHDRLMETHTHTIRDQLKFNIALYKPDVIVVNGFTPSTLRLRHEVVQSVNELQGSQAGDFGADAEDDEDEIRKFSPAKDIKIIYVHDDVARLFQNSRRALADFRELVPVARYCVGLARYAQSPLCEFASLGRDLTAITYDPHQKLVSKLCTHLMSIR